MENGFQFDIVLFGLVAVFLVLQLVRVLGRRDGHEGGYDDPFDTTKAEREMDAPDNVIPMPGTEHMRVEPEPELEVFEGTTAPGLEDIRKADPSFNGAQFAEGSKGAFEMILNGYANGDTKALKDLLSPSVFADFARAIKDRETAGETLEETLVGFKSAEIIDASMQGKEAHVTVKFVTEQVSVLYDSEHRVLDGDPTSVSDITDIWTFSRTVTSRSPNWLLVSTASLD